MREQYDDERMRCGGCGSRRMIITDRASTIYGKCRDCGRTQEVEMREVPESEMCDNCAFRKNSPERQDPYRWAEIMEIVEEGRPFHCHKGLPFDLKTSKFDQPSKEAGRVTICAGWIKARLAHLKKEIRNETTDPEWDDS